jgi:steroid 5-alpha reductase family enzyme
VASPLFILFLLLRVSGIPLTEAQALKTKGEAYRHYQRTTSVFVPWFPLQGGKDAR